MATAKVFRAISLQVTVGEAVDLVDFVESIEGEWPHGVGVIINALNEALNE